MGRMARSWAGSGSGGMLPSRGRCTVVKQMLYSWMMEGYSELKSSSSTMLVYSPFFGSRTSPPAYCALPFLPPGRRSTDPITTPCSQTLAKVLSLAG